MQLLDEITNHIDINVDSLEEGVNLNKNYYPDEPDTLVSVIHGGGFPPERYTPTRELLFNIKIRAINYDEGVTLGNQIMELFNKDNYQLGSFFVLSSYSLTELSYLYEDKNQRDQFSLDIAFLIKK